MPSEVVGWLIIVGQQRGNKEIKCIFIFFGPLTSPPFPSGHAKVTRFVASGYLLRRLLLKIALVK